MNRRNYAALTAAVLAAALVFPNLAGNVFVFDFSVQKFAYKPEYDHALTTPLTIAVAIGAFVLVMAYNKWRLVYVIFVLTFASGMAIPVLYGHPASAIEMVFPYGSMVLLFSCAGAGSAMIMFKLLTD